MSLSSPFIRRPVATTLLNLSIVLAGAVAFTMLPVSPLPQVDFPVDLGHAPACPGASPETMASSVATPLERALGTIAGVNEITSCSSQGSTRIIVQFDLGKDINAAAREVQAAINASRSLLPSAMPGMPSYRKINPSQAPIMILALTSKTKTPSEIYDLASTVLAQKVAQVTGVGDVTVGGGSLPAVRVELEPNALTQYGISLDDVRRAITGANLLRPKGRGRGRPAVVADPGERPARQGRRLPAARSSRYRNGAPVRLADVAARDATTSRTGSTPDSSTTSPAVLLVISRQPDANIIKTVDAIHEQLPALRAFLPADVDLGIASDRSPSIRATLHDAERTLLIAVALVILVVLLFLASVRAAVIPVAAVPVALVGSFAVMYLWGFSLNNLSLMALIVATGLVVDDAIVVLENISRHVEMGKPPFEAALVGAREVGVHAALDEPGAGGGVRLDPVHGRHRRAAVPRVLDHARGGDRDLAVRLAHAHADALRALARPPRRHERLNLLQRASEGAFGRLRRGYDRPSAGRCGMRRWSSACCSASSRSTWTSTSRRRRASCRSRTPGRLAASSAATTACRSR